MKKIGVILLVICVAVTGTAKEIVEKYEDGCLKKKYYVDNDGNKYGSYLEYHENGKRKILARYEKGNLHGTFQLFFPSGKLQMKASFIEGKLHGPYIEYSEKGKLIKEELYVEGALCYPRPLREINSVIGKLEKERKKVRGPIYKVGPDNGTPQAGEMSESFLNQALTHLKIYRYLAGVPYEDITLNNQYNSESQHAAVLLSILKRLSHNPWKPKGVPDEFYLIGKKGCQKSNLHQGRSTLVEAIDGWMNDSDSRNVDRLGHRRWCLNPKMQQTGFGMFSGFCAIWALDSKRKKVPDYDYVCFPVRGYHPVKYFKPEWAWHVSLNPRKYRNPDDTEVKAKIFPVDRSFRKGKSPLKHNYKNVNLAGFGIPNAIIFRPENLRMTPGTRYLVEITGVKTKKGKDVTITYFVEFSK